MIFSLFGNKKNAQDKPDEPTGEERERYVRPMEPADIASVLDIIFEHDEDDGEEAKISLNETIEGMYVAIDKGDIVGVTGASMAEGTDDVVWLSWTYVHPLHQRQGIGRYLVHGLLSELEQSDIRKIFISTGDYVEDGEDIYFAAKAFYENLGARLELKIERYYDEEEARYIYGLDIAQTDAIAPPPDTQDLVFDGLGEADESEDGALLSWHEFDAERDKDFSPKEKLLELIEEARDKKVRFIGAAIPSDLSSGAIKGLSKNGFTEVGKLDNYYAPGIDQQFWMLELD